MCGPFDDKEQIVEELKKPSSEIYILEPFLTHEFEPYGWPNVLATVNVCTN